MGAPTGLAFRQAAAPGHVARHIAQVVPQRAEGQEGGGAAAANGAGMGTGVLMDSIAINR